MAGAMSCTHQKEIQPQKPSQILGESLFCFPTSKVSNERLWHLYLELSELSVKLYSAFFKTINTTSVVPNVNLKLHCLFRCILVVFRW
jgi:hypothetical protein